MPVERDLAFVVEESVRAGDIVKAAQAAERSLVSEIGVFDIYQGKAGKLALLGDVSKLIG